MGNTAAFIFVGGFVGGLLLIGALLLVAGGALLVWHITIDLLALLLVRRGAGLLVLGLVLRFVGGRALLGVRGGALLRVDRFVDLTTSGPLLLALALEEGCVRCHDRDDKYHPC